MNTKRFVLILVGIILISLGIAGATLGKHINPRYWQENGVEKSFEEPLDIQDIKKIVVICDSANVEIVTTDEPQGKAAYYTTSMSNESAMPSLEVKTSEGILTVEVINQSSLTIGIGPLSQRLEILIPAQYSEDLDVEVKYGNVKIGGLLVKGFDFRGDSGNLDINGLSVGKSNISVKYGNVRLNDFKGDLALENSSGNTEINYAEFNNNRLEIQTEYGNIELKLPANAQFSLDASTEYGRVKCSLPITVQGPNSHNRIQGKVGEGTGSIIVSASSGNIKIAN